MSGELRSDPVASPDDLRPRVPRRTPAACPFCGDHDTEQTNTFGPHASVSSWWCRSCRSPFEVFKWGNHPDDPTDADE